MRMGVLIDGVFVLVMSSPFWCVGNPNWVFLGLLLVMSIPSVALLAWAQSVLAAELLNFELDERGLKRIVLGKEISLPYGRIVKIRRSFLLHSAEADVGGPTFLLPSRCLVSKESWLSLGAFLMDHVSDDSPLISYSQLSRNC